MCRRQAAGPRHMPATGGRLLVRGDDRLQVDSPCMRVVEGCQHMPATGMMLPPPAGNRRVAATAHQQQVTDCQHMPASGSRPLVHAGDKRTPSANRRLAPGTGQQQAVGCWHALKRDLRAVTCTSEMRQAAVMHQCQVAGHWCMPVRGSRPPAHAANRWFVTGTHQQQVADRWPCRCQATVCRLVPATGGRQLA